MAWHSSADGEATLKERRAAGATPAFSPTNWQTLEFVLQYAEHEYLVQQNQAAG